VTSAGSAAATSDYTTTNGTVTFAPGSTGADHHGAGDRRVRRRKQRDVQRHPQRRRQRDDQRHGRTATIQDDDASRTILISDITTYETDSGTSNAVFTLTMSRIAAAPVTVNFATPRARP
jgi:hypothetical protein